MVQWALWSRSQGHSPDPSWAQKTRQEGGQRGLVLCRSFARPQGITRDERVRGRRAGIGAEKMRMEYKWEDLGTTCDICHGC